MHKLDDRSSVLERAASEEPASHEKSRQSRLFVGEHLEEEIKRLS